MRFYQNTQLAKFFIIGGGLSVLEWLGFYALCFYIHYIPASLVMFVMMSFCGIVLYRRFVFVAGERLSRHEIYMTYFINTLGIALNTLILWILVEFGAFSAIVGKIIASGIVAFYGFFARKILIYKE